MSNALMTTYSPLSVSFTKGQDVWLWDKQGNKYLDAYAGIAVTSVGHSHPKIVAAITDQANKILHTANLVVVEEQVQLAEKLSQLTGMDNAFFCSTGAEANECAIKLARLYGNNKGVKLPTIIVAENAFHGRTMATLTASGSRRVQAGFEPLVQGFVRTPYDDLDAIKAIGQHNPDVVAVMIEPIQGESGIRTPSTGYLESVRQLCDENNWLLIFDEVQTGVGRLGSWFAFQQHGITPDILTSAKALGNGIPVGACLAKGEASKLFQVGNHGSTFGGNPLSCRVALTVLEIIEQQNLLENAKTVGSYLKQQLQERVAPLAGVNDVRGHGLMLGVELNKPARAILDLALANGLIFNIAGGNTIRLVPPLTLTQEHADMITDILVKIIPQFMAQD